MLSSDSITTDKLLPGRIEIKGHSELKNWRNLPEDCQVQGGVVPDNNPKSRYGLKKAPTLSVVPASSLLVLGQVMALGASKYGRFNWREKSVATTVYSDAMLRHLIAWSAGQDTDPESGVSHLGHVMACACILIDAQQGGNLIDDRSKNDHEINLLDQFTKS